MIAPAVRALRWNDLDSARNFESAENLLGAGVVKRPLNHSPNAKLAIHSQDLNGAPIRYSEW